MYPEYTGTALLAILQPTAVLTAPPCGNRDSVYRYVAGRFRTDYHLTWLEPIGFNNAYALMMRSQPGAAIEDPHDQRTYQLS